MAHLVVQNWPWSYRVHLEAISSYAYRHNLCRIRGSVNGISSTQSSWSSWNFFYKQNFRSEISRDNKKLCHQTNGPKIGPARKYRKWVCYIQFQKTKKFVDKFLTRNRIKLLPGSPKVIRGHYRSNWSKNKIYIK